MENDTNDTLTAGSALVWCPVCNNAVRESRLQKHMERAHSPASKQGKRPQPDEMTACPHCDVSMRASRLSRHIRNVHNSFVSRLLVERLRPALSPMSSALVSQDVKPLKGTRLNSQSKQAEPPIGQQVLEGLRAKIRWTANCWEPCITCKRRVVFLELGGGRQKAFDVDRDRRILGTHSCEERSESVFACQAGIVDSNRRRH